MSDESGSDKSRQRASRWQVMAARFLSQARVDLESANENIRPRRYHNAVLFAEQAAEKGLKAAHWRLLSEEPPWTHRLDRLATALSLSMGGLPDDIVTALGQMSSISENSRYPSGDDEEPIPADLFTEADAQLATSQAEKILTWVESLLRTPSPEQRHRKN